MIYALLRLAWEKNILVLGLAKDIAAADMIKTVLPILQHSENLSFRRELPRFNSDKMLLQTASIINAEFISAPWRTLEYDTCFRTIAPLDNGDDDDDDDVKASNNSNSDAANNKGSEHSQAKSCRSI